MEIDYEAAWMALKGALLEKRSWGQDELFREMARAEVENHVPAGGASLPPRTPRPPADGRRRVRAGAAHG